MNMEHIDGTVLVRRSAYGKEVEEVGTIKVPAFTTQPARVRVTGSITKNLGDYNSARVEVAVEMPCQPHDEDIRETHTYISNLLDELIPQELEKAIT
jgi:hypothetical protein